MRRTPALLALALAVAAAAEAQESRVADIQIAPRYLRMRVDAQAQLTATAYDADGIPMDVPFQWSSSNINIVQVAADGMVRALAPGAAVVTAVTGTGTARRLGQVSVFVMRPGATVMTPVPPTPAAPPTERVPGVWVSPAPPAPPTRAHVDSMIRASIDCTEPFVNAINPARACWDERAHPREPTRIRLEGSLKAACPGVNRTVVSALVHVSETGAVTDVRLYAPTGCHAIDAQADSLLRGLGFTPAVREGQTSPSWVRLQLRAEP